MDPLECSLFSGCMSNMELWSVIQILQYLIGASLEARAAILEGYTPLTSGTTSGLLHAHTNTIGSTSGNNITLPGFLSLNLVSASRRTLWRQVFHKALRSTIGHT